MKAHLLGLFVAIGMTQSALATTFKIVDLTAKDEALSPVPNHEIEEIAAIYTDKPTFKEVSQIKFSKKKGEDLKKEIGFGIQGSSGFYRLKGVGFVVNGRVYKVTFAPVQVPEVTDTNVLIEICKIDKPLKGHTHYVKENTYYCRLYKNSLLSGEFSYAFFKEQ